MQYIVFSIINTKLMAMGGGDPVKAMEERAAYLEEIRRKAEEAEKSGAYQYGAAWNKFPVWVRQIIKNMAFDNGSKAIYEDENAIYRIRIKGEREEYDAFYDEFQQRFTAARNAAPENIEWSNENIVHVTSTADDENDALFELDAHHSGQPSQQKSRKPEKASA